MKAVRTSKQTQNRQPLPQAARSGGQGANDGQESPDAQIKARFRALRHDDKVQFLTVFETALKMRSWPASSCHQPEQAER